MNVDFSKLEAAALNAGPLLRPHAVIEELMRQARQNLIQELIDQGHRLTGNLINTAYTEVQDLGDTLIGSVWMDDYAIHINDGIPPNKIPYQGGSTSSPYIDGLTNFWRLRGLAEKQARSAAFATARKHKREGMPTRASYAFSSNGRRTGFIDYPLDEHTPTLVQAAVQALNMTARNIILDIMRA